MKINYKFIICFMLTLMFFSCVNAGFAADGNASDALSLDVNDDVLADGTDIYVSPFGDNSKDGSSPDNAVATISHALEIADEKIILLEGTHKTGDLGTISGNLTIAGQGNAIIDADNNNRILYVGEEANVVISDVTMINGYSTEESGGLLGNNNRLTLINCVLANSSSDQTYNGGAIYNVGKLTLINSTIANCTAKEGGAIFTNDPLAVGNSIELVNSRFINNYAKGNDNLGGGAIFAQQITQFTIENTSFIGNKAGTTSSGGAIFVSHSSADITIKNSEFISNHANGQDQTGGGAIYRVGTSNYQRTGTMTVTGTLFENNTCDANGGAIYAKATTVTVSQSAFINNTDSNGLAVYGYKTEQVSPSITLNDNWWSSNDSPKSLVGGNNRYAPTINRWAVMTLSNDSEIIPANTVKLTVSINTYTTGTSNGTLSKPITVKRDTTIKTTSGDISGILENGEFSYDYLVPENIKFISASVDNEVVILLAISSQVNVEIADISAKKYGKVNVEINVTSDTQINTGNIELYVNSEKLIATFDVKDGKAIGEIVISQDIGNYTLTAKYINGNPFFDDASGNATLTVDGICELYNETFFNFFEYDGLLRDEIAEDELIFHGEFSGLDIDTITIPRSISIKGENATIYDIALSIISGGVKVSNINFTDKLTDIGAAVSLSGDNIELNNISISYDALNNADAYAVFAEFANGFKLTNSTVIFNSDNMGYIHHAIHITDSNDVEIRGNLINASLPARDVDYHSTEPWFDSINQETVLAIGIQNVNNAVLTENEINVETNGARGSNPTIDAVIVYTANNLEISWNNITHIDTVNAGKAAYSNAIDLYAFNGITVKYNNILVNTTSGIEAKGTAYPIQATGSYDALVIDHNNLTSISNGPALAVYSQNYDGQTDILISFNNINATGIATSNEYALVSGIELQDTVAKVYNNTIYSQSKGSYDDKNALYGISYAQYTEGSHTYDIKNNTVYTKGKYAVYLQSAKDTNITDNLLIANELKGDKSAIIVAGENNVIENNRPMKLILTVSAENVTYPDNVIVKINASVDGDYAVDINGTQYNITANGDGLAIELAAGSYYANISGGFSTDDEAVTQNATFTVFNGINNIEVIAEDTALPGDVIVKVIADVDGIYAVVIGENTVDVAVEGGEGTAAITLPAGKNYVATTGWENENYTANITDSTFSVIKGVPAFNITAEAITYGEVLVVEVTSADDISRRVSVTIGNETKFVTIKDGVGFVKFSGLTAGTQTIVVTYSGDANYAKSSANTTVKVNRAIPTLKATANAISYGEDLVVDVKAPGDLARRVAVTIDGNITKYVTLSGGMGSVKFKGLGVGVHNIDVSYDGDSNYKKASINKTVRVSRSVADIKIKADSVSYGDDVIVNIAMPSDVTRRANVVIDGNVSKTVSLKDGIASVSFSGLGVGIHTIEVTYDGDANYLKSTANKTVRVNRATPDIQITADDINVGEPLVVDVQLPEDVTRRVNVAVGNQTKLVSLKNGSGTVKFTDLEAGTYDVEVSYSGDSNYSPSSNSAKIDVKS